MWAAMGMFMSQTPANIPNQLFSGLVIKYLWARVCTRVCVCMQTHVCGVAKNHKEGAGPRRERVFRAERHEGGTLTSLRFFIAWGNMPWCNCNLPTFITCTPLTGWLPGKNILEETEGQMVSVAPSLAASLPPGDHGGRRPHGPCLRMCSGEEVSKRS